MNESGIDQLVVRKLSSVKEDHTKPTLVGVAGGSASGKTTLCNRIIAELSFRNCAVVSLDSFYKGVPHDQAANYNFDIPNALDFDLCFEVLKKLLQKEETKIPVYNFAKHAREEEWETVRPADIILFEGILALHDTRIVDLMSLKIFVQCDDDIRLYRRLLRDVKERGRDVQGILYQYNTFVKPSYNDFIGPSMKHANIIVPGNADNTVAVNLIVDNLRQQVKKFEDIKGSKKGPINHEDMLNSNYFQLRGESQPSELLVMLESQNIFMPNLDAVGAETLNIFKLFSKKFSKSLYKMGICRLVTYDIKMVLRRFKEKTKKVVAMHYLGDLPFGDENVDDLTVAVIVPILDGSSDSDLRATIERLCAKSENMKIFVFAIFAEMDMMVELTQWKKNVSIINNLCLLDSKQFEKVLIENCRTKFFEFNKSPYIIDEALSICKAEIEKQEKNEKKDPEQ